MPFRKLLSVLLVLFPGMGFAAHGSFSSNSESLKEHEIRVWAYTNREAEFSSITHTARNNCHATRPPEALATPSPLLDSPTANAKVKVSFIIDTDGRVQSPFILESAGSAEDRVVLDAVRAWRYRPATCNGVPTESEAKIRFSSR
jgi:TonB family protein